MHLNTWTWESLWQTYWRGKGAIHPSWVRSTPTIPQMHSFISSRHHLWPVFWVDGKDAESLTNKKIRLGLDFKIASVNGKGFVHVSIVFLPEYFGVLTVKKDVSVTWELASTPSAVRLSRGQHIKEASPESYKISLRIIRRDGFLLLGLLDFLVNELFPFWKRGPALS